MEELKYENDIKTDLPLKTNKNLKKFFILVGGFFIFLIVFFLLFFFKVPSDFPKGEIINVKEDITLQGLSRELKNQNLISSKVAFEVFMILFEGEKHIIPGDYLFEEKEYVYEIARRISEGEKHLAPVKITIPEGFTNLEIAELSSSKLKQFDKNDFLKNAREGYMFPDTYFFLTTDTHIEVLNKINANFEKKIEDLRDDIVRSDKTEKDIIIMASIIEREAKGDSDREYISGILWNRIRIGMALQADAAPITYKERGLPKAPIANPGLASIRASIYPKSSAYLYYIHDKEGNIYFARTFTEHRKNIEKYLK